MAFFQRLLSIPTSPPTQPREQPQTSSPSKSQKSTPTSPATTTTTPSSSPPTPSTTNPPSANPFTSTPLRSQLTILFAGVAFVSLSTLITHRAIARRKRLPLPRFFQPSNAPPTVPVSGAMEALEALNIATVNVLSYTFFATGGLLWAFDVRGYEDLRTRLRTRMGFDGLNWKDAEEELEEWVAETLSRKEEKRRKREEGGGGGGGVREGGR